MVGPAGWKVLPHDVELPYFRAKAAHDICVGGWSDAELRACCIGFVGGVHDLAVFLHPPRWPFCKRGSPDEATNAEQVAIVVKQYLIDHPENHHLSAAVVAFQAMTEEWPCEEPSGVGSGGSDLE